jgi:SagB-type dehydrogenase family enzyme
MAPARTLALPPPSERAGLSLNEAIARRRSIRQYAARDLTLHEIGQLLWSAQGMTSSVWHFRASPSAGALYPLELYVALRDGVFHYRPGSHELAALSPADVRTELEHAALDQSCVGSAPCVIIVAGVLRRSTRKYGDRGVRYVHMEAGHAAQNILLQAAALGLGSVPVGAFEDERVAQLLKLDRGEQVLYLLPVGGV